MNNTMRICFSLIQIFLFYCTPSKSIEIISNDLQTEDHDQAEMENFVEDVFNSYIKVNQTDQFWMNVIREKYLMPPSVKEYNFSLGKHKWYDAAVMALHKVLEKMYERIHPFGGPTKFFVEYGVMDGEFLSNTLLFEETKGWTGLIIEADPEALKILYQKNRKAWIAKVCLSLTKYPEEVMMTRHRIWLSQPILPENYIYSPPKELERFIAKCIPILSLLSAINVTTVDYFRLGLESSTLEVLKIIPFNKIHVKVVSLELTPHQITAKNSFMTANGYELYEILRGHCTINAIYVKKRYIKKLRAKKQRLTTTPRPMYTNILS